MTMSNADLADFEFKGKAGDGPSVTSGLMAPALAWTLVMAALAIAGPIEGLFRDHGIEVGSIMKRIVEVSNLWFVPAIAAGLILLVHFKVLEELARLKKNGGIYRRVWMVLIMTPPVLILGLMIAAVGWPLIRLITWLA
jgi:hypothetical protein